ncbi:MULTISPECIES: 1,2-phenylacetyl-CoA epoxidase subunit PaaA [Deinococcus]|uniref:1,2-phenylacetyl-CoA epoxidase subunit A n=1 Tax=Deinococcus cavernae TaxID=2320857 RepID=A0A418V8M0_9DEIO|nr:MULTISPECIES: 1,2-phenylacetyl-CoA epoxidase subunit PaaA [Deinococcus]RJF72422.1 1,2-phenylacetyl-CoA epoxidase subunit A [Deinococcus cavernae]
MTQPIPQTAETPEQLAAFEARIAAGEKIESGDWMPEAYRKQLIRMISQHAHSEVVGMLPEGAWITRAPNLHRKMILIAKVQDEAGHGQYLYHAAETLGTTREEMLDALLTGKAKYSSIFNYPTLTWADIGMIGWLVDGAAIKNQTMLAGCSYGPYSRAMVRICSEETFHHKQGKEMVVAYAREGTPEQKKMAQDALNRWWWPAVQMLGPSDKDSPNTPQLMRWGIKLKTNDEVRQEFINEHAPELLEAGLTIPDPDLHQDEQGNWIHGPINWEEFFEVIKGGGQMNRARLESRNRSHDEGAWVREALNAYEARRHAQAAD